MAALRETFEETGLAIGRLEGEQLHPALHRLDYLGRAITPASSDIRYHARFFLADAKHASGEVRDSRELLDLRWLEIHEALRMTVADVTEFVLGEIEKQSANQPFSGNEMGLHLVDCIMHDNFAT